MGERALGRDIVREYDRGRISLAVPASHSALQLMRGARDEHLRVVLVSTWRHYQSIYKRFPWLYDRLVLLEDWGELADESVVAELRKLNAILVPHGSLVEYVGVSRLESLELPMLGNRFLLSIEADWGRKIRLLEEAGIDVARTWVGGGEAAGTVMGDGVVIVKLPGAKGGRGYRIARATELPRVMDEVAGRGYGVEGVAVQEYVIGVRVYAHYFHSPVLDRVELLGIDQRWESNVDGLYRLPPSLASALGVEPEYTVVANSPMVVRESLLARLLEYGERFAQRVLEETGYPPIGPYSLEGVVTPSLDYKVFEFSGRIVAGTNTYTGTGSPYSWLYWNEPMYMGRRVAREVKMAIEKDMVEAIVT